MITEEDKKIQLLVLPTRTVFTSFAKSVIAVFNNDCISAKKCPSSNTGVFVQCCGQHNVLLVVDA